MMPTTGGLRQTAGENGSVELPRWGVAAGAALATRWPPATPAVCWPVSGRYWRHSPAVTPS
ncbi:MAG: hypothetical protein ACLUFT_11615 [Gemmiger formicilis]|uniref:hypothetical protein n=1 Tax=Gemmiger formicilis TaxID=745368 RepID=UPI003994E2AA